MFGLENHMICLIKTMFGLEQHMIYLMKTMFGLEKAKISCFSMKIISFS